MSFYYSFFHPLTQKVKEGFQAQSDAGIAIAAFLGIIVLVVIHVFVVQFLWNSVLVSVVSVRPLKTLLHTLGLIILIALLFPGAA